MCRNCNFDKPLTHQPHYTAFVVGSPFQPGNRVIVTGEDHDDTFDVEDIGKGGVIILLDYDAGCVERFPDDPFIRVRFDNGEVNSFWKNELKHSDVIKAQQSL